VRTTIPALLTVALLTPTAIRADLVAHFPFDGDVADATGNGNDGTFFGDDAGPSYIAGHDGTNPGAILFDGANDYVRVTQTLGLPVTDNPAFTVAMWVNAPVQRDRRIFSEGSSTSNTPLFNLGTHNAGADGLFNRYLRPGPGHQRNSIILFDETWKHVVYVDDDGEVSVYIDGVRDTADLDYTRQLTGLDRTSIGGILRGGPCCHLSGAIDDVRLYDHALSQAEVRELIPVEGCPPEGDTHCDGIEVVASPVGGGAGRYSLAASATDDSGDTIFFEIEVFDPDGNSVSLSRSDTGVVDLFLGEGAWTISVLADDDLECLDEADDARCVLELTVNPEPLCVSHWTLDGDLADSGPGGNDGTWIDPDLSGENYVDGFDGSAGGALSFDGVDDLVSFTQNSGLPIYANSAYTVTMWVRGPAGQVDRRIFSEGSTSDGNPLLNIGTHNAGADSTVDIYIRRGATLVGHAHSARDAFDDDGVDEGEWHHIAWVDDNGSCSIYIDGILDSTMPSYTRAPLVLMDTTTIGGILRAAASHWFAGAIDDVRVYNHALDEDTIVAMVPEPDDCEADGDTSCDGLVAAGPAGAVAGNWTLTATGSDAGEDPLWYTFELTSPSGDYQRIGPTDQNAFDRNLTETGTWIASVCVDDHLLCRDEGESMCCEIEIEVRSTPALRISSWTFSGDLLDSQGDNDGAWNGDGDPVFVQGWDCDPAGAISFSGDGAGGANDDVIIVAQNTGLPLYAGGAFTIAMWVKAGQQADKRIWSEGSTTNNRPLFNLGSDNTGNTGALDLYLRDDSGSASQGSHVKSTQTVFDGTWHHVCWVDDNGDVTLYVDGIEDGTDFDYTRPTLTLDTTTIGGILRGSTCCELTGTIDDVMIFNYAISTDEVAEICGQDSPSCCPEEGDTHCDGLNVQPLAGGGGGANTAAYEVSAVATDDSGDDVIFTFEAAADGQDPVTSGPGTDSTVTLELAVDTTWTVTVTVDDDPDCGDIAGDASCSTEVSVPVPCPAEGDTHCQGLDVAGDGSPGEYVVTATAVDDSGDDIRYTFTAVHPTIDPPTVVGPQASPEATLSLAVDGDWLVTVTVDDDPDCDDVAEDATCSVGVEVSSGVGPFTRGDVDGNGVPELTDAVFAFNYLFLGGARPPCFAAADTNLEGDVSLTSGVYLLSYLFLGGDEPPAPFPGCGNSTVDTDEALGCDTATACDQAP